MSVVPLICGRYLSYVGGPYTLSVVLINVGDPMSG